MKIDIKYKEVRDLDQKKVSLLIKNTIKLVQTKLIKKKINNYVLSVLVTNNLNIKKLNFKYKNVNKETNVLSFPQENLIERVKINENVNLIGDIVLSIEKIEEEAKRYSKKFEERLTHILIHGFLHLLGYNHENSDTRKKMEKIEKEMMLNLNMSDPYCF
ncbi:MAG: rRNA maturation RNase YbeY [Rickettsiales bacterium]|nr:rRNA maturation RNase YbeY [Rickettsiales bacterium]OUV54028.1 MAG: rRNA maturation RNase YbeY [Rickettsiales bacterium TMED127]|tara:strand:- start:55360 stop:55839 length:480 start_codon:yes stop_codon:yes gene_type:complete